MAERLRHATERIIRMMTEDAQRDDSDDRDEPDDECVLNQSLPALIANYADSTWPST